MPGGSSFISPSAMLLRSCEGDMVCDMTSCVAAMSDGKAMKRAMNLHSLSVDTRNFRSSWPLCQILDCSTILVYDKDNKQLLKFLRSGLSYVYQTSIDMPRTPGSKWTGWLLSFGVNLREWALGGGRFVRWVHRVFSSGWPRHVEWKYPNTSRI